MSSRTALLVIAHGSRQKEANDDVARVVTELREWDRNHIVEGCFLELADPDIDEGGRRCVAQGARRVILLPYFLSAGVHVRRDLAESRSRLAERFPEVAFLVADPLGPHPLLLEILKERAKEAGNLHRPAETV